MEYRARSFDQSGLAPENFTTFVHFSVSSPKNFPKVRRGREGLHFKPELRGGSTAHHVIFGP
jgi:hypothetical protein